MEHGVWYVLGNGGIEERPSGRDDERCVVAGEVFVCGGNDYPKIMHQVDGVVINAFQDGS